MSHRDHGTSRNRAPNKPVSWRGSGKKGTAGGNDSSSNAWWTMGSGYDAMKHTIRLVFAVSFVAVLVVLIAGLIEKPRIRTPFVALVVTNHEPLIPPNSLAKEDGEWFAQLWARTDADGKPIKKRDIGFWGDANFEGDFSLGGPDKNTLLVYVSAHGVVNSDGKPCLLLSNSKPHNERTWKPLRKLLQEIIAHTQKKATDAESKDQVRTVVFLDASRMLCDLRLGLLYNGFNEKIKDTVKELDGNLVVVNSASAGELGWIAPEYGASVFGRFVGEGLSGLNLEPKQSDRVTLGELAEFLHSRVASWVQLHRAAAQHPRCIATRKAEADKWQEWPLAWTSDASRQAATNTLTKLSKPTREANERCGEVEKLWRRYDEVVRDPRLPSSVPLELDELHFQLARLESLVVAGKAYGNDFKSAQSRANVLMDQIEQRSARPAFDPLTVAEFATSCDPDQLKRFSDMWTQHPNSKADAWQEVNFPRNVVAAGLFKWLVAHDGEMNDLAQLDDMLQMIDKATVPTANGEGTNAQRSASTTELDFIEVNFLRMLAHHMDRQVDNNQAMPAIAQAIQTRSQAEASAMLRDARAHYWIRDRIERADRERRLAQDRLFVGSPDRLKLAVAGLSDVANNTGSGDGQYARAEQESITLANAFRVRDRAWSQLPMLATWLVAKAQYKAKQVNPVTAADFTTLTALAESVHELADKLDQPLRPSVGLHDPELNKLLAGRAEKIAEINALADQIETDLNTTSYDFRSRWANWPPQVDESLLGLWGAMLQIPLTGSTGIPGKERRAWRENYLALLFNADDTKAASRKGASPNEPAENAAAAGKSDTGAANLLNLLADTPVHPLLAIIRRQSDSIEDEITVPTRDGDSTSAKVEFLAEQSSLARKLLDNRSLKRDVENLVSRAAQGPQQQESVRAQRLNLSKADNMVRAVMGLAVLPNETFRRGEDHPIERLERLDMRNYLLWQAGRAMLDLWNDEQSSDQPYYVSAFHAYANSADDMLPMYDLKHQMDGVDLKSVCDELIRQLDEEQLATPTLRGDKSDKEELDLPVTAKLPQVKIHASPWARCEPYFAVEIPGTDGGKVELKISAPGAGQTKVRRIGFSLHDDGVESALKVRVPKEEIQDRLILNPVGFFRGRRQVNSVPVPNPRFPGIPTVVSRPTFPKPTVTVSGSLNKKVAIMFVLDCSRTMAKRDQGNANRLQVARAALNTVLNNLLDNLDTGHECRIGLLVYGHRAGWDTKKQKPVFSPAYQHYLDRNKGAVPVTANDDIETVVHLGNPDSLLNEGVIKRINDQAAKWVPLGNTPLYYSMELALREFQDVRNVDSKHLIVITDGQNNVDEYFKFAPKWLTKLGTRVGDEFKYSETNVAKIVRGGYQDIEINVLGIGMKKGSFDTQLKTITNASIRKGKFYPVSKKDELLAAIEKSLGIVGFTVEDEEKQFPLIKRRLNELAVLKEWPRAALFDVSMPDLPDPPQSARLFAQGGEAFDLRLDSMNGRIVHQRYEPPEQRPINGSATDAFVSVFYPQRDSDSVTFSVTIQNKNPEEFSPRPVGVWATITPLRTQNGDDPIGPPVHCYDLVFEHRTPVPVLKFTVPQWPPQAYSAKIELWYRVSDGIGPGFQDVRADGDEDLSLLHKSTKFTFENIPGGTFTVRREATAGGNGWKIIVDERYDDGQDDPQKSRVLTQPMADKIIRYRHPDGNIARHVFEYYGVNEPQRLIVTSRASIQNQYSSLDKPIIVKLPERH